MSEDDPVEAGRKDFTLTCTVHEVISGLVNMPSAHWIEDSSLVTSGGEIVVTETLRNGTTAIVTLTFSTLHTSHAGQYMCQGTLVSPAAVDDITSEPANVSVNISSKCFKLSIFCDDEFPSVPEPDVIVTLNRSTPLYYTGTGLTLTCAMTLDPSVDDNEEVSIEWYGIQHIPQQRYTVSAVPQVSGYIYTSSLTISPLAVQDNGTYTCIGTVTGQSNILPAISHGNVTITVTGKFLGIMFVLDGITASQ